MRFFRHGSARLVFVPQIADGTAPTAAELAAGRDLTAAVEMVADLSTVQQPAKDWPEMRVTYPLAPKPVGALETGQAVRVDLPDGSSVRGLVVQITRVDGGATVDLLLDPEDLDRQA